MFHEVEEEEEEEEEGEEAKEETSYLVGKLLVKEETSSSFSGDSRIVRSTFTEGPVETGKASSLFFRSIVEDSQCLLTTFTRTLRESVWVLCCYMAELLPVVKNCRIWRTRHERNPWTILQEAPTRGFVAWPRARQ
ncbi:hypothetical protein V1477_016797 [Vespula maculifrons]|uniref:Uncharacterized protein n=1 Tax=Vespula maculifrons TaxID=7453 RepID=A0ABD2B4B6_VESMC